MPIRFIYFDLGNVLVNFNLDQVCWQIAAAAGVSADRVRTILFDDGLEEDFETGRIGEAEFFEKFRAAAGTRPDPADLKRAARDIFALNVRIMPIVHGLRGAGNRMGILSNTCSIHWLHVAEGPFATLASFFEKYVLSYEVGVMKPDPKIYQAAIETAGVQPAEIFFTDDRPENVVAARESGIDAVHFTSPGSLLRELFKRQIPINI
jgi:HAD superfamily hydrolase (TIGR01509 family)